MTSKNDNYIVSKMATVLVVPIDGINLALTEEQAKINLKVEAKVKEIVNKLKMSHAKFEDPDFGPLESDEFGAKSLYGAAPPDPAGSKYPSPESLMWQRPQYDDNHFSNGKTGEEDEEEDIEDDEDDDDEYGFKGESNDVEIWCKHGNLFLDGSSSGDVIQGQLGDCWFLSALAVMGANEKLLESCFWNRDSFKEHGVYVLRFFKDTNIIFVIIDDRIPVKAKDGRVIFAGNKDPNELWVPLIEKGYAKLHGCYKALIGGYTHYGLADMTGYCPRLIVTREGYTGYSVPYSTDEIWSLLLKYKEWKCLMGCSIQSNPKEKTKVEAKAGMGLHMGHAYSLLDVGVITTKDKRQVRLLKIRNPWGRGEWEGAFGDNTPEREENSTEIERVFFDKKTVQAAEIVGIDANDGTFFMTIEDWMKFYTSLFVAIRFPNDWCGKRSQSAWKGDCGGNRKMGSWMSNPKVKLRIEKDANGDQEYRQVFVGLYIKDSRLTLGSDYIKDPLYASGLSFDIVTEAELTNPDPKSREFIPTGRLSLNDKTTKVSQPPYNYGATQVELFLKVDTDYYIVPSLANRGQAGPYFLNVYVNATNFHLDGAVTVSAAQKPMIVGKAESKKPLKMSVAQFYEKKELLRERIVSESKRLKLSVSQIEKIFNEGKTLSHGQFKKRMMDMGFSLADFPDDDLIILDLDNDGTISAKEFIEFFKEGVKFVDGDDHADLPTPQAPVDDLLYKSTDLEGELCVNVFGARYVREATTWFNSKELAKVAEVALEDKSSTKTESGKSMVRKYIKYDPAAAATAHTAAVKERAAALEQAIAAEKARKNPPPTKLTEIKTEDLDEDPTEASDTFSPDRTHKPGDFKSAMNTPAKPKGHTDGDSVVSTMSVTFKEANAKAGSEAANKLHQDATFKIAEISRTKSLGALRSFKQHKQTEQASATGSAGGSAAAVSGPGAVGPGEGVLRKKSAIKEKVKRRDITKDADAMAWLNYRPSGSASEAIPVRQPLAVGAAAAGGAGGGAMASATVGKTTTDSKEAAAAAGKPGRPALTKTLTSRDISLNEVAFLAKGGASGATGAAATAGTTRYREVVSDLWDYLVDCVITISVSRPKNRVTEMNNSLLAFKRRKITADSFLIFNPVKTPLPAPVTASGAGAAGAKTASGHAPTPKNARRTPGQASVTTLQAASKQKNSVLDAKEKLKKIEEEQRNSYEEIYRRLVLVPTTTAAEMEGDGNAANANLAVDSNAYLKSLFKKFDKNLNGVISKDEFQQAMTELNIDVSTEDCNIFFSRFGTKNSGGLDWVEFLNFFQTKVMGSTNAASTSNNKKSNLVDVLIRVKKQLMADINDMTEKRIASLESYFLQQKPTKSSKDPEPASTTTAAAAPTAAAVTSGSAKMFVLPDNAIFQNLLVAQAKENADKLKRLGVTVSEEEMARISRIFLQNVSVFMAFIRLPDLDLHAVLDISDLQLGKGISLRSGLTAGTGGLNDLTSSVTKLWNSIAPNVDSAVQFDDMANYFSVLLCESLDAVPPSKDATAAAAAGKGAAAAGSAPAVDAKSLAAASSANLKALTALKESVTVASLATKPAIQGVNADILCRIITDSLIYSNWNRITAQAAAGPALLSTLSFSGLDAYVRNERINYIDRKLKYLMQLESNFSCSSTYLMVHAYISRNQDELIILGHDSIMGDVYKLSFRENLMHLPVGEKCAALFPRAKKDEELALKLGGSKVYNSDSVYLYNPWDTPAEDAAISDFVSRLRVVRGRSAPSHLIIAEEPQFISTLKSILDTSTLPFFSVLNDLTLSFSVDVESTRKTSLRGAIFGSIRSQKSLYSFIVNVSSSLNVVLSTYNSDIKEAFKWTEMLAHLTNYRNPFVTVQLLPKFVEPEEYIYVPTQDVSAFAGDEESDALAVKKGPVAYDGAPHPVWNTPFKFSFQPPRLTNCKVLCTEIAKMKIENACKYIIVMVRQSKKTIQQGGVGKKIDFRFLTIYDPRSATEYQCGVKEGCKLHDCLFKNVAKPVELDEFMVHVGDAADKDLLILGPAITPRIVINMYNHNGRSDELLGSCQVSISSVLSGSGVSDKQWVTMTYKTENSNGKSIDANAGDVELELGFRKQAEIDAEIASAKKHAEKSVDLATLKTRVKTQESGSEPLAVAAAAATADVKQLHRQLVEKDKQIKELSSSHESIKAEFIKLKDVVSATNALAAPVNAKHATAAASAVGKESPRTSLVDEKAMKELAAAREEAKKLAAEKAAMEKQVKDLQERLEKANTKASAGKKSHEDQPVGSAANADAKLSMDFQKLQEAHEKLLKETADLKAAMAASSAGAAVAPAAASVAAPAKKKSPRPEEPQHHSEAEEPEKVPHKSKSGGQRLSTTGATAAATAAIPAAVETTRTSVVKLLSEPSDGRVSPTLPTAGGPSVTLDHSDSAVDLINITDTTLDGIIHSILKILVSRNGGNRKTALEGFQSLLFCHAKANAELTNKDIIAALGDMLINISTEQSILMVREIVPRPSQPVTVASIIDLFHNGMLSLPAAGTKKTGKKSSSGAVGESIDSLQYSDSETQIKPTLKYPEMIPAILSTLVARHEKRGLVGGNVLNGLQKLLNANAVAGMLSDKKMSDVLKLLMFDVSPEQCARLMKALDPDFNKSAPVEDIIEVFRSELVNVPKPLHAAVTVSSPVKSRRPTASGGHGKAGGETQHSVDDAHLGSSVEGPVRPKAERPSSANPASSIDKTVRAAPALGSLHSKSSGNMNQEGKSSVTSTAAGAAASEIDWSKEPLPEGWERKRLAKNNKLVYVNKQLEEIRWQHPLDPSKPKPKKSSGSATAKGDEKARLNKTDGGSSVTRKPAPAAAAEDDVEGEGDVVDEKAKTLPLPKKSSAPVAAVAEKDETEGSVTDRGSYNGGEDADDEA